MLFTHSVSTSAIQLFHLLAIRRFRWLEVADVTRPQLWGRMRGQSVQNNIVVETKLQQFEGLMRGKAVIDQHSGLTLSSRSSERGGGSNTFWI